MNARPDHARRNILLITTDQQRYDSLGCNGGTVARTPTADRLAADGIRYERAYCQNTVCMPARSTILTGQYASTHGVRANGVPLPEDAPSIAAVLGGAGYRTALVGKAHFEPILDPDLKWAENRMAVEGVHGPYRGFEHVSFAGHGPFGRNHYSRWLKANHPELRAGFAPMFDGGPTGDTGAPETARNPIPRELYHTAWVADATLDWLGGVGDDEPWFCWMSFPDPHHPWDPPASEQGRFDWRDLDLPTGYLSPEAARKVLADKPAHWSAWFEGRISNIDGAPVNFVPANMTADQVREINALVHVENELIDEACASVLAALAARGWDDNTDIIFTTDHGELQGDLGLLYKGPFHVDSIMRLPMIWRPAPIAGVSPATVTDPVGQVDLAPTLCDIADIPVPDWMQGDPLPIGDGTGRERAICEWDSQFISGHRMRSLYRDGWMCTTYLGNTEESMGIAPDWLYDAFGMPVPPRIEYDGTEGELYDLGNDPLQQENLWDDRGARAQRDALLDDLAASMPEPRPDPLAVESMA